MRACLSLLLACAVSMWSTASGASATGLETPEFLDYLYVEPNSGGSSGGHAAVCLGESCYHFQQIDGSIRLRRESFDNFDFDYRVLGNRSVHLSRIAIANETKARLSDAFDRRLWAEERHFEVLAERVEDRLLLERLRAEVEEQPNSDPLRLPGSGYFAGDQRDVPEAWWSDDVPRPEALADLARRIEAAHGTDFLDRRAAELRSAIAALEPSPAADEPPAGESETIAPGGALFSLPELALVSVRKGSFAFAPRQWAMEAAQTRASIEPKANIRGDSRCANVVGRFCGGTEKGVGSDAVDRRSEGLTGMRSTRDPAECGHQAQNG